MRNTFAQGNRVYVKSNPMVGGFVSRVDGVLVDVAIDQNSRVASVLGTTLVRATYVADQLEHDNA